MNFDFKELVRQFEFLFTLTLHDFHVNTQHFITFNFTFVNSSRQKYFKIDNFDNDREN